MTTTKTALNLQGADGKTIGLVLDGIFSQPEARAILDALGYKDYEIVSHSHEFFRFISKSEIKNALGIKAPYYCKNGGKYYHFRQDGVILQCQYWANIKEGFISRSSLSLNDLASYEEVDANEYLQVLEKCKAYYNSFNNEENEQ